MRSCTQPSFRAASHGCVRRFATSFLAAVCGKCGLRRNHEAVGLVLMSVPTLTLRRAVFALVVAGLWPSGFAAAAGASPATRELFGPSNGYMRGALCAEGVDVAVAAETLRITAAPGAERILKLPLESAGADLASYRFVETEIANRGPQPITFTFWALSGPGWGGVSTYPGGNSAGRETLAPGARAVMRIDLHARYPGTHVFTPAIDPRAVRALELVFESSQVPLAIELGAVRATGVGLELPLAAMARRVKVPDVVDAPPAAGLRAWRSLPSWRGTAVRHVLTLPKTWRAGRRYPVIVEYTGNRFFHKFCHSTGRTADGHLAYGLAAGGDYLCLNLPFVSADGQREQTTGWGDIGRTIGYAREAIEDAVANFGGDRAAVIFTGFSRGAYAGNAIALHDDHIAGVWRAFLTSFDPGAKWSQTGSGWNKVGVGWDERAARMRGRPWFYAEENLGADVHVDVGFLEDRPSTLATRAWLRALLSAEAPPVSR